MQGSQQPRIAWHPDYATSTGKEAIELAALAGLHLDPWEALVLEHGLGERANGKWAAFEVGLVVPRQNGKGVVLQARELAGLFLLNERLIIHSAHEFSTSLDHFQRLLALIESTPEFDQRVKRVSNSHGDEGIELKGGQRIRFRTRTKGGARGFSCDCLVLDEAMFLPESAHGALLPTLSARPNPQVWYAGSPVDQYVHDNGVVLARVRDRGLRCDDPALAYFEWSLDRETPRDVDDETARSVEAQAVANPGLGIWITEEHIAREYRSLIPRMFAVERLGVGDWPAPDGDLYTVIALEAWRALADVTSTVEDPVQFAFDVAPDRSMAAIAAAGARADGLAGIEIVEYRRGTGWLVERLAELVEKHGTRNVICDGSGPAASLVPALEALGVEVVPVSSKEQSQACGLLYDAVEEQTVRHRGSGELQTAIRGAARRPLGEAWAWSRKTSAVDICPLVAVTLALWGHLSQEAAKPDPEPMVAYA